MAVQFILGRSGTGKTTLCIKQIIESLLNGKSQQNLVFLVPEQATYQAERAILSDSRIKGYSRLHVLSFQRLCYMIFGKNLAARPLTSQARDMIVHRLLCENAGKLSIFSSAAQRQGTASSIAQTISELQKYGKSPDDVETLIKQLGGKSELTAGKLTDINLIYKQYLAFVEGNFLNSDNQLNLAKESVSKSEFLKDCSLWVDGFAGFTTSETMMLAELLKVCSTAKIAMCLDPAALENDYTGIFEPTAKTYGGLLEVVKSLKLQIEKPVVLDKANRFANSKALGHLEKNIFSFDEVGPMACNGEIKITACAKTRLEVDYVARQICELVREKNYRWRDIAVIASDIDQYHHFIQAIFGDFNIPFFIDRRRCLQQYPAVELITSALKIATDRFSTNDVINYLKSDLASVSRAEVDLLENYCLAFGIEAKDWLSSEKWHFAQKKDEFDNDIINKIRVRATEELLQLRALMQREERLSAEWFYQTVLVFLDSLNVRQKLADWTNAAFKEGRLDEAQLHQQFFSQFTQLMDDFLFIFKDSSLTTRQYASLICSMFSQITVALIPPALDQVLVGSIERSRHPDLKAVFLIGGTQKQFPIPIYYDNILNDNDRKVSADAGFELACRGSSQLMERRYLAYIAFTRPSQLLNVTYPLADEKGTDVQPSFLVEQLKSLFTDLVEEKYYGSDGFDNLYNTSDLSALLAARLGKDNFAPADNTDAKCKWLLDELASSCRRRLNVENIKTAIDYTNTAALENPPMQDVLATSATRLKSFASCPFRYFSEHIMKLKERRIFELEPFSLGLFYHKVLEILFGDLKKQNFNFSNAPADVLSKLTDAAIEKLLLEDDFLKSFKARTKHNSFIVLSASEMIKDAVLEFSQIAAAGKFNQIAAETGFGRDSAMPAIELSLPDGKKIHIDGKIDRVDLLSEDGKNYCLVVDYKTSQTSINWSLFGAGLDLQLPIYLLAIKNQTIEKYKNLIPLGAFYFKIQSTADSADIDDIETNAGKIKRKPKGIFNGEYFNCIDSQTAGGRSPYYSFGITQKDGQFGYYESSSLLRDEHFDAVLNFAENKLKQLGSRILSGEIEIKPYKFDKTTACANCKYKAFCRFDWQINGYSQITKISKTEFFETSK
ncbi:MAG: exodeoxyribonuclease V subunit gamma [Planctomycetaceae bacterium]|nr:exodeoxyribonuclease V subunit gamma [Planctomycetaceae bacterium]